MERTRKCHRRTDGRTDGQTKAITIIPHPLRRGGLTTSRQTDKYKQELLFIPVLTMLMIDGHTGKYPVSSEYNR